MINFYCLVLLKEKMVEIFLSVVIPCLNEEQTIGLCINKCLSVFKKLNIVGEVIVSDNGSTDTSIDIAKNLGARVVACTNKGYGAALKNGFAHALGKYVLMGDADDSYDFNQIDKFLNKIEEDYDMVIGTRLKGTIHKGAMPFLHRYLGNPVLTFLVNLFGKLHISDSQCGMRIFKKNSLNNLKLTSDGMEFATELLLLSSKSNWKIAEIPIEYFKDGRNRKPHLKTWSDGFRHLRFIFKSVFGII